MDHPITLLMMIVALISLGTLALGGCAWTSSPR